MNKITVSLAITREQYLQYYQGSVSRVVATAVNGQRVQFPANILKPFVSHNGINGLFELSFDGDNKFQTIIVFKFFYLSRTKIKHPF